MPDDPGAPNLPEATVVPRRRARISAVWIIPIVALLIAAGIGINRIRNEGPTITIVLKSAEGIEAGKTFVKYKDVNIGQVTSVQLTRDYSRVEVKAKIIKSAEGLMVEDATFWVVAARITLSGVSGLATLLSGNYIGFEVGQSKKSAREFVALETPPIITGNQPGRTFVLKSDTLGSLGIGSPVYYRRLPAGQVVAYDLAPDGRSVEVKIFVNSPFDKYVHAGTRFWNASGIDVSFGGGGLDVHTESLVALLVGGVAFDTPSFDATPEPAPAGSKYTLHANKATALKEPEAIAAHYVLYFNESLRGLTVGAPVTLLGLPAGEVTDVGLDIDPKTQSVRGRVEIVSYPERLIERLSARQSAIGEALTKNAQQRHAFFLNLVEKKGLRAQLRSSSLITGQLYVALDFFPDAPPAKLNWNQEPIVLPVVPSTVPDLEAKLTNILAKLDRLPLDAIADDARKTLTSVDTTVQSANKLVERMDREIVPGLDSTLGDLRVVLGTANGVLKKELNTTLGEVNMTLTELRGAIGNANGLLTNTNQSLLSQNAPIQQDLRDALQEVARAARALRVLMDYLERHPSALIRGKTEEKP